MRYVFLAGLSFLAFVPGDDFPKVYDSEPGNAKPMPADEAAKSFKVPPGFKVEVFASEPTVRNPIAMAWDPKGRLWVAENFTYAEPSIKFDMKLRDRVVIFEDADGDGKSEKQTVFTDDVQRLTSVEVGLGGVWLMAPPQLLFIPDRDGDDKPDGPAEVVLDGFEITDGAYHNLANGLKWGPDGWLYGRCGASSPGEVGVPGTPKEKRIPQAGGLWRYHPKSKTYESLTHGTTNPWGHDWTALGEAFFINTVCGHLWHSIPGMHFVRSHSIDPNPKSYELIDQHADHYHWDHSKDWTDSRKLTAEHNQAGGGHAHSGMIIYGGTQWPQEYRGRLLTINYHGRRLNRDRLDRDGSGFVGKHEPDIFFAADPFFRGVELSEGPDGAVYVMDWNDTGECHENTGVVRSSGRIYKLIFESHAQKAPAEDLTKMSTAELAKMTIEGDEWHSRQSRMVLRMRAEAGDKDIAAAGLVWQDAFKGVRPPAERLRALWAINVCGLGSDALLMGLLKDPQESMRVWAIRLLTDKMPLDMATGKRPPGKEPALNDELESQLNAMANDPSGLVRLALASTLQRLPATPNYERSGGARAGQTSPRLILGESLMANAKDAKDHNLPLLIWYGMAPVADENPGTLSQWGRFCELPTTRKLIARRVAEELARRPDAVGLLVSTAASKANDAYSKDILTGMTDGLRGWRKAKPPREWKKAAEVFAKSSDSSVRDLARELSVVFGDGRAIDEVKAIALDGKADLETRRAALKTLIDSKPDDLRQICEKLLGVRHLNMTAVRGLALFDDPGIGNSLSMNYRAFQPSERSAVLDTLVSRKAFAGAMLDAMAKGAIPKGEITAFHVRQIRSMNDEALSKRLAEVWGELRETPADKAAAMTDWKAKLTSEKLASADKANGRAVFNKLCASCHTLYGQGGAIGPDLTGAGRDNLDYVLENVLDPSAQVPADYRMVVVAMKDGRILNGIVKGQTDKTLTLQTQTEALTLARPEIEEIKPSTQSLMPEGQLAPLSEAEVRDLVAYLMHRSQVPLK